MQTLLLVSAGVFLLFVGLTMLWDALPERRSLRAGSAAAISSGANYTVAGHFPRLHVLHADRGGLLYGIEDHFLFVSEDGGKTFSRRGALPKPEGGVIGGIRNRLARSKITRRMRANPGPTNIEVLASGTILVFWDRIYRSTDAGKTFSVVCDPAALGVRGGPFVFGVGTAVGPGDTVYFGEYTCEKRPHPVSIVRGSDDGRRWEIAHRFEAGEIFHVHSIHYDPYRRGYLVCTGDYDSETALLFTADDFKTLIPIGKGGQEWRIVSLIVTPDYLYWGSDKDCDDGAAIYRWHFGRQTLEKVQHIGKVSYFATRLTDGTMAISTTYEPNSRYTLAHAPRPSTEVWLSRDGEHWNCLLELEHQPMKGAWGPARAQIAFPAGRSLDRLFLIPRYTVGNPFETVVLDVHDPATTAVAKQARAVA